jgi:hypothetical protein
VNGIGYFESFNYRLDLKSEEEPGAAGPETASPARARAHGRGEGKRTGSPGQNESSHMTSNEHSSLKAELA